MPDPRDLVAPVDEGAELDPPTRLPEERDVPVERGPTQGSADGDGAMPGRIEERRPLDDEIPHAVEPDQPPDR